MNLSLLWVGLAKAGFGIIVGVVGVFVAARALHRLLGTGSTDAHTAAGNTAVGVLTAGSLAALGILFQHPVATTFDAMDLLFRGRAVSGVMLRRFLSYAVAHLALSIVVAATVLALGTLVFTRLTRNVDEMAEIRKGNVAPAIVLAAVMVVLALMTAPGLQTALDGLLPLPTLARDQLP